MRRRFRNNIRRTRLPSDSRTIPMYGDDIRGDGLDHGKWFRCWHCGWACNQERDSLGDSQSRSGAIYEDYAQQPDPGYNYGSNETGTKKSNWQAVLGGDINSFEVATENDSYGNPKAVKNAIWVSDKSKGCPFCHTLNWQGNY